MTSKAWYQFLLNKSILQEQIVDPDGNTQWENRKVKAELLRPDLDWEALWRRARQRGLSNTARTFLWRMLHNLLPTGERLNRILPRTNPSNICLHCNLGEIDNIYSHTFTQCTHSAEVMTWLIDTLSTLDPTIIHNDIIWLQFTEEHELVATWIVAESLEYSWAKRMSNEMINMDQLLAHLRTTVSFMTSQVHLDAAQTITRLIN